MHPNPYVIFFGIFQSSPIIIIEVSNLSEIKNQK